MIVRLLFWLGLSPWILVLLILVLTAIVGQDGGFGMEETAGTVAGLIMLGPLWTVFCWTPALVYRLLFGRRKTKDA